MVVSGGHRTTPPGQEVSVIVTFRAASLSALVLSATLVLSSCVETADQSIDTSSPADSPTPAPSRAGGPAGASTSARDDGTPEQCNTDPRISGFGPFLAQAKVPLGQLDGGPASVVQVPDFYYHFQLREDGLDSCRALSYLVLEGSNGDAEGSAGVGSAIADAVVFFIDGELVTTPAPFQMKTVESVTRLSDSELQVRYGHAGGATAPGVTEYYTLRFFLESGGLSASGALPADIDGHARLYLR